MSYNELPGNPFSTENAVYTEDANNSSVVNATLALAFEQRTANLIAFEKGQWEALQANSLNPEGVALWKEAANQISGRLGLKAGK